MKLELTESEITELLPKIQAVLNGDGDWEDESAHFPVGAIASAILTIPGVTRAPRRDPEYGIEGFATNGWQWDWWQDFEHEGTRYTLSGSGYYGGHAFFPADED